MSVRRTSNKEKKVLEPSSQKGEASGIHPTKGAFFAIPHKTVQMDDVAAQNMISSDVARIKHFVLLPRVRQQRTSRSAQVQT